VKSKCVKALVLTVAALLICGVWYFQSSSYDFAAYSFFSRHSAYMAMKWQGVGRPVGSASILHRGLSLFLSDQKLEEFYGKQSLTRLHRLAASGLLATRNLGTNGYSQIPGLWTNSFKGPVVIDGSAGPSNILYAMPSDMPKIDKFLATAQIIPVNK
jgi:hypothetical protein